MTKRKKLIIASVITAIIIVSSIGAVVLINLIIQKGNVTVSGEAYVSGALSLPPTTIQTIEFADTQTGAVTVFHFHFASEGDNRAGNYSVTLKNEHTYYVYISFYFDGDLINTTKIQIATFTVNATAGQTAITKDFI